MSKQHLFKMVGVTVNVTARAKETLDRQAKQRGMATSVWAGQVFDMGFAAVCAREKSMPISDADLDAIVSASLLLWARAEWTTAEIAKGLGVSEPTVERILDGWRNYRRGA